MKGDSRLFVGPGNKGYNFIKKLYSNNTDVNVETSTTIEGMKGNLLIAEDCVEINQ